MATAPSAAEFVIEPTTFRTLLLERLNLPLQIVEKRCACGELLDSKGRHRAACTASGRVRSRAVATERCVQRICREAGAIVQPNALLRDMNIGVCTADDRRIEVLASGLPLHGGAQLAVDVTLRGFLTAQGESRIGGGGGGQFLANARADKERKYHELLGSKRCKLVVLALSTGGRWSTEAIQFIQDIAWAKARSAPEYLRASVAFAWQRRWAQMLSVSAATAFANSLVMPGYRGCHDLRDGAPIELSELFGVRGDCAVEGAFAGDPATAGGEGVGQGPLRRDGAGSFNQPGGAAPVVGLPGGAAPAVCEGDGACVVAELGGAAPAGLLLRGGAADFSASGGAAPLVREGVGQPGGAAPADDVGDAADTRSG